MKDNKTTVKVWLTRHTRRFRALIKEEGQPAYEVTVGGKAWQEGKGREHEEKVLHAIHRLITYAKYEQINIINGFKDYMEERRLFLPRQEITWSEIVLYKLDSFYKDCSPSLCNTWKIFFRNPVRNEDLRILLSENPRTGRAVLIFDNTKRKRFRFTREYDSLSLAKVQLELYYNEITSDINEYRYEQPI